jgi:L-rhamnose mutarotase
MVDEYRARHARVWPEMREALSASGWRNYSLFLTGDGTLVGYLECDDFVEARQRMAGLDVNERWQADMRPFFQGVNGDPDRAMTPIPEIFHLP